MGAKVCCPGGKTQQESTSKTDELVVAGELGRKDQEKLESSQEVGEAQFNNTILGLVKLAANGFPKALRSTYAKRNEMLRKHNGDMNAAAEEVRDKGHTIQTEVKEVLMALIPYVGLPLSILKPMWVELRRGCLIAAIYGHDLSKEETLSRVLMTMGVAQGEEKAKEKTLELAIKCLWSAFCQKCGLKYVAKLPVAKMVSVLPDFESKAKQALVDEFKKDAVQLNQAAYTPELDPRPSNKDLLDLVREQGERSLRLVREEASGQLLSMRKKVGF